MRFLARSGRTAHISLTPVTARLVPHPPATVSYCPACSGVIEASVEIGEAIRCVSCGRRVVPERERPRPVVRLPAVRRVRPAPAPAASSTPDQVATAQNEVGPTIAALDRTCPQCGFVLAPSATPAGFWIRVLAAFVDFLGLLPVMLIGLWATRTNNLPVFFLTILCAQAYKPLLEWRYGATWGKMLVGVKIVDGRGERVTLSAAILRSGLSLLAASVTLASLAVYVALHGFDHPFKFTAFLRFHGRARPSEWMQMLSFLTVLDVLTAAFAPRKQALHDMVAGTFCVYRRSLPADQQ